MNSSLSKTVLFSLALFAFSVPAHAVINFTFSGATDNGATVSATSDGVMVTVSDNSVGNEFGNVDIFSGDGSGVDVGFTDFIFNNNLASFTTFRFDTAVDVTSIGIDFISQSTPQENPLTLTAISNTNETATITIMNLEATIHNLNFTNITSFTIADDAPGDSFFLMAYDNLVVSESAIPEPSAFGLLMGACGLAWVFARRRQR